MPGVQRHVYPKTIGQNNDFFSLSSGAGHNLLKDNIAIVDSIRSGRDKGALRRIYLSQSQKNLTAHEAQNPFLVDRAKCAFALKKIARHLCFYFSGHLEEMRRILLEPSEFIVFFNNYLRIPVFNEKIVKVMVGGRPRLIRLMRLKPQFALLKEIMSVLLTAAALLLAAYLPANLIQRDRRFACMTFFLILMLYFPLLSSASTPSRFRIPILAPMVWPSLSPLIISGRFLVALGDVLWPGVQASRLKTPGPAIEHPHCPRLLRGRIAPWRP